MSDRLPYVLRYAQQGFRVIPCHAGTKEARASWTRYQQRDPTRVDLHRWWPGTEKIPANIALILGPKPGGDVVALNVNRKNGHDGLATLTRLAWTIPPTPTIRTPSGGLCYFFRVPDVVGNSFPFNTHVHPDGYGGLEFRGAGGYQLVPPSRMADGPYQFVEPWTLERLRTELAELPGAIVQAWVMLDQRRGRNFGRDDPTMTGDTTKEASTAAQPTDLSPPQPKPQKRSQARPTQTAKTTTPHTTTITTRLTAGEDRLFVDGFDLFECECAEAVCGRLNLSIDFLGNSLPFHCRLPGHRERDPSASWFQSPSGYYLYTDWHERSREHSYTVPEVFAALTSGVVQSLPKPSRMAWRLRLMVEEGWLTPEPVRMRPLPDDASDLLRHYCEGFRFLVACKSCHPKTLANAATPFAKSFAAAWCGLPKGSIWAVHQEAMRRDLIVFAGIYKGQALYRPGKDE